MNTLKDYVNWKLTHADKVAEAEGYPLTMENCKKNKRMKQLEIYGSSVQEGTPTPDNPVEVQSVGEKSVNLFGGYSETIIGYYTSDGAFDNTSITAKGIKTSRYISLKPNTTYTISGKSKNNQVGYIRVAEFDSDKNFIKRIFNNVVIKNPKVTFTTDSKTNFIAVCYDDGIVFGNDYGDVPSYIIDIQLEEGTTATLYEPYGKYKIPVVQRGKNLWDKENYILDTGNEKSMLRYLYPKDYSWLKKGETFTISATIFVSENDTRTNTRLSIEMLGTDGKIYNNVKTHYSTKGEEIRVSLTYTIPQLDVDINIIYIRFIDYSTNTEKVWDAYVKDIQIELSDTATDYEPYIEPITTNVFLNEPLRKVGDYADYVDFKNRCVVRRNKEIVLKGADIVYRYTSYGNTRGFYIYGHHTKYNDAYINGFYSWDIYKQPEKSTHFIANQSRGSELQYADDWYINSNYNLRFHLAPEAFASDGVSSTLADIQAWVQAQYDAGTPLRFIYRLAQPIEETINIELPKLQAKTTIIEVDTSLAPSNSYGKYIKK